MNMRPGDGHYLSLASVVLMTNHITGANSISYTDLTPIVHLMSEYQAMAVPVDSPFKTAKDLIDRLRADPTSVRFGLGTSLGGSSHISISMVAKAAGIDVSKPSKAGVAIEALTTDLGARVSARTIEEHLKNIPDALERRGKASN